MRYPENPLPRSISLALVACLLLPGVRATATEGKHYVALRQRAHYDRKLTYATIQNRPASYVGRVFEVRGTVGGTVETDAGLTIMLNLPDKSALMLDLPRAEESVMREASTPSLRVLVQVEDGGSGNVVPLRVLAVAHESEVSAIEAQVAARYAALEARQRATRQSAARITRGTVPSRGDFGRSLPDSADVQSLAAFWQPFLSARAKPLFSPYLNFISHQNSRLTMPQAAQITAGLLRFADTYNVDPRLVVAMIIAESGFDPNSTSNHGAMGLGQLMPGTAKALGVNNAYDPIQNLNGSINYLRSRLDTYRDKALPNGEMSFEQIALAMAAYNAGANAVKKYGGIPPYRQTQNYVKRVISLYQQLCQG